MFNTCIACGREIEPKFLEDYYTAETCDKCEDYEKFVKKGGNNGNQNNR